MLAWEMTPEQIKEKQDKMLYSFSRVNAFYKCLYGAYLHYIEEFEDKDNAFNQYGKFMHKIHEMVLKNELDILEAPQYYKEHYDEAVTCKFPPNVYSDLDEKAYQAGLDYLLNVDFDFEKYRILGVEKEFKFKVGKYPFRGIVDLILRDKKTDEVIICDHKTTQFKYLKDGSLSKAKDVTEHFTEFKRQLYLYCIPVIKNYGKVDKLVWNMIRDQRIITIPFDEKEFKEAQEWAINTIDEFREEELWLPDTSNEFFCRFICGQSGRCIYHN